MHSISKTGEGESGEVAGGNRKWRPSGRKRDIRKGRVYQRRIEGRNVESGRKTNTGSTVVNPENRWTMALLGDDRAPNEIAIYGYEGVRSGIGLKQEK
jgi:hypothetical protein